VEQIKVATKDVAVGTKNTRLTQAQQGRKVPRTVYNNAATISRSKAYHGTVSWGRRNPGPDGRPTASTPRQHEPQVCLRSGQITTRSKAEVESMKKGGAW